LPMKQLRKRYDEIVVLDCTIRDGGYVNNWHFDKKVAREVYRALSKAGVDIVEIGFRGSEKYFNKKDYGLWKFSAEADIREITQNIHGAKLSVMADFGKIDLEDFCDAKDSLVKIVRLAVHKNKLKEAVALLEKIKGKGYEVSLNAMGYTNYSDAERKDLIATVKASSLDYLYIADSYGSLFPDQIKAFLDPLLEIPGIKIGFHPHNSIQMAFANTLEAIRCGVHIIDSTIYGMGRAAGNLPTEIIVSFLEKRDSGKFNVIPILNIIDRYFVAMQKEMPWGYQLPYMLSGMFQCHPNYAKALVDAHEYTMEDIWKALDYVKKRNPVGFSKPLLREIVDDGFIGGTSRLPESAVSSAAEAEPVTSWSGAPILPVPYEDRYKGRDFLIMANGPTLREYQEKIQGFIQRFDPVVLGSNYLGGLFVPQYHAFNNKRRFMAYVDSVAPESRLLIGQYITDEMVRDYCAREYEQIYYLDRLSNNFDIKDGVIQANCRTIAVLLLGVAIVMGARRVFAVGLDGYTGMELLKNFHFYKETDEKEDHEMIIARHQWCKKFITQIDQYLERMGKEGVHILTPTSYKSFYKGIENYL
jgi:4-hydroxy 2-oxovalerate aldolase